MIHVHEWMEHVGDFHPEESCACRSCHFGSWTVTTSSKPFHDATINAIPLSRLQKSNKHVLLRRLLTSPGMPWLNISLVKKKTIVTGTWLCHRILHTPFGYEDGSPGPSHSGALSLSVVAGAMFQSNPWYKCASHYKCMRYTYTEQVGQCCTKKIL